MSRNGRRGRMAFAALALAALPLCGAFGQVTHLGQGSYATQPPLDQSGAKVSGPLAQVPQPKGVPLAPPVQTTDWWTSHVFKHSADGSSIPLGSPVIPQPLELLASWDGLQIRQMYTFFWKDRHGNDAGAQGPGFKEQLCQPNQPPECFDVMVYDATPTWYSQGGYTQVQEYSAWFSSIKMVPGTAAAGRTPMLVTAGRGSPFAWVEFPGIATTPAPTQLNAQPKSDDGTTAPALYFPPEFLTPVTTGGGSTQGAASLPNAISFTVNGRHYALFGPPNSYWTVVRYGGFTANIYLRTPAGTAPFIVVAALPQNLAQLVSGGTTRKAIVQQFGQYAFHKPANRPGAPGTVFTPTSTTSGNKKLVNGTFSYNLVDISTGLPVPGGETLFALFPHQIAHLDNPAVLLSPEQRYTSSRGFTLPWDEADPRTQSNLSYAGQMKLGHGSSFVLRYPFPGVLDSVLPLPAGKPVPWDPTVMAGYLQSDLALTAASADTYSWGKQLTRMANNYLIAKQVAPLVTPPWTSDQVQKTYLAPLKLALTNWLTADNGSGGVKTVYTDTQGTSAAKAGLFYYNQPWGTLIGYPAGYGSDTYLNDHHFHYGYFIRAAAILARDDAAWRTGYGDMVGMLVRDIAAGYGDPLFPPFRCFDPYAGHSVASGAQQYADGVNQESSSEAINAWYGMILWGQLTADQALLDRALYMYASETDAARRYWFCEDAVVNGRFGLLSNTLADLYDGLVEYNGFGARTDEYLHIINWLPYGGGSLYLGANPTYAGLNYNALLQAKGTTNWSNYGDLIWMYRAFSDAADAKKQMTSGMGSLPHIPDSGNTKAMTYHWVLTLPTVATSSATMGADSPLAMSFEDPETGGRSYTAFCQEPAEITFEDGTKLFHPGGGYYGTTCP